MSISIPRASPASRNILDDQGALYTASLAEPSNSDAMPAQMSIDIRVQHALADELGQGDHQVPRQGGRRHRARCRYRRSRRRSSRCPISIRMQEDKNFTTDQMNQMTSGVFELGSVIKAVTFAMAFDYGVTDLNEPLRRARSRWSSAAPRSTISMPTRRVLTVPEVFTNSSNIGTAQAWRSMSALERHQEFLRRVGLFDRLSTELPESAKPLLPRALGPAGHRDGRLRPRFRRTAAARSRGGGRPAQWRQI